MDTAGGHSILTGLTIRNFKLFGEGVIELGERVVFVGPNNSGKTSALQALLLWHVGVTRWLEKRGGGPVPEKRPGVTINRRDLVALPVPAANLLWRNLKVREGHRVNGKSMTKNILVEVEVEGVSRGSQWRCGLEFDYANEESFYCRPLRGPAGRPQDVPAHLGELRLAYLPPMSGLVANEVRLDAGAINVAIGEGRTAEVLRNLCWLVLQGPDGERRWANISDSVEALFGTRLDSPEYVQARGEITMTYQTREGVRLDLASSGRGQQQTLLLLAHMTANPGAVVLLDEPDAHLEILRQRQIYQLLSETASATGGQVIAASHSEVILNEAADRDTVVAFIGSPHRIDDRGSQLLKSLKEIGFEHYYQAETCGWVLYLEGSTDLAILRAFAQRLDHPTAKDLTRPFVHYVGNQPQQARDHFYALREAKPDLIGCALYDRLERTLPKDPNLRQRMWGRREIENYLCQRETLLAYADDLGRRQEGDLFGSQWVDTMEQTIDEITGALQALGKGSPWDPDLKVSDEFLTPVFANFFKARGLPNLMSKTDFHTLVPFVPADSIDAEVVEVLDLLHETAAAVSE